MSTTDAPLSAPESVKAIAGGRHSDPFGFLGPHTTPGGLVIRCFLPRAEAVAVVDAASGAALGALDRVAGTDLFHGRLAGRTAPFAYRLRVSRDGGSHDIEDPYRFGTVLGDLDAYLFGEGTWRRAYERMGAHPMTLDGVEGTGFVVWAPAARRVSVVGDFNGWDGRVHPMRVRHGTGLWEIFLPGVTTGQRYKFEIVGPQGTLVPLKADPFALQAEMRPSTASIISGLPAADWRDADWMAARGGRQATDAPISVYEVHLGSWQRGPDNRFLTYQEIGDRLIAHVRQLGFTHVEFMPVSEHPFDGSWGYQPIGLFAPTSRHGTPEDFRTLVDRLHGEGIGVLLDWVPGHFPTDAHGLAGFDGTHLYEHADPRQGFHPDWNTLIYNFGRREVSNFLLANALFWLDRYHIDGLRVDAVASMLYLDYSRKAGEWVPNRHGGRENLEAIELLRAMNSEAFGGFAGATTIAEESTAWPGVSRPVYTGGLGFGYKWNMGWMHDTLQFMSQDPIHRRYHHGEMTFGLLYAFTENFVLPLSHDEVVHGKGSLLAKMPGDDWQKFANLRAYYGFMWCHPGKKLLFMGGEFGQWKEWDHNHSLDWHLVDQDYGHGWRPHGGLMRLVGDLNRLYRETPALHQRDCSADGFEWIEGGDLDNSVFAWLRKGEGATPPVLAVSNFTPVPRRGYRVGLPSGGLWREVLNTDAAVYGGSDVGNPGTRQADAIAWHGRGHSIALDLPPLATIVLKPEN
ncbi:MAG: 1,4-alpha-glucan branching protein GlgB [Azospirillaceae bacterium]